MSTITLNSKTYPWANWTPTGLSRFVNAGTTSTASSGLTFGSKANAKAVDASAVLAVPYLITDPSQGPIGAINYTNYTTVRRQVSAFSTLTERTDELARLRALVLTTQFSDWFLSDVLPV